MTLSIFTQGVFLVNITPICQEAKTLVRFQVVKEYLGNNNHIRRQGEKKQSRIVCRRKVDDGGEGFRSCKDLVDHDNSKVPIIG